MKLFSRRDKGEEKFRPKGGGFSSWFWGSSVTQESYFANGVQSSIAGTYADVHFIYEIVGGIASAGSILPLKIYGHTSTGQAQQPRRRIELDEHPSYKLLRAPNPETPRHLLISQTFGNLCLHGNAFWLKVRSQIGGPPIELWALRPERMRPIVKESDGSLWGWEHFLGGTSDPEKIPASEIIHFRTWSPVDDYVGMAPISALRYQIDLGKDAEQAAIDLWRNGAQISSVITVADTISDEAVERLAEEFRAKFTGRGGRYKMPFLEQGMDVKPIALNPRDAEFINTARMTRERVAAAYGYSLPEMYPQASPEEIRRMNYANGVQRWTVIIEETLEMSLMPEYDEAAFPQFVLRHILEPDLPALAGAYKDLVYAGILSPDYAATLQDFPVEAPRFLPQNVNLWQDGELISPPQPNREPDSRGGFGGDQGRDNPSLGSGGEKSSPHVPGLTSLSTKALGRMGRDLGAVVTRTREVKGRDLDRKLRGIITRERAEVFRVFGLSTKASVGAVVTLVEILEQSDAEIDAAIRGAMVETAARTAEGTAAVFELPPVNTTLILDRLQPHVEPALGFIRGSDRETMRDLLGKVATAEIDSRQLQVALEKSYETTASRAAGVARTETAWSASMAAHQQYAAAGVRDVQWVFGGGPCGTGTCITNAGASTTIGSSFDGGAEMPPAHPNCTCYTIPAGIPTDLLGEAVA